MDKRRYWCKIDAPNYMEVLFLRFQQKIDSSGDCWEWTGSTLNNSGYGQFKVGAKNQLAHRVAYTFRNGSVPDGLDVLHKCDNPKCVNPDHLFIGSHKDNMVDKTKKGRTPSKLKPADIPIIRALLADKKSLCSIAKLYGVSHNTIGDIKHRITWTHI